MDGTKLIAIAGEFGDYFVPLYEYYPDPQCRSQMVDNVRVALDLLNDDGVTVVASISPESIVDKCEDALLRILHQLFQKYKTMRK